MTRAADAAKLVALSTPPTPIITGINGGVNTFIVNKFMGTSLNISNYTDYNNTFENTASYAVNLSIGGVPLTYSFWSYNTIYCYFDSVDTSIVSSNTVSVSIGPSVLRPFESLPASFEVTYTTIPVGGVRYIRLTNFSYSGGFAFLNEFVAYSGANGTGTAYRGTATASYAGPNASYSPAKAIDNDINTGWWTLSVTGNTSASNSGPSIWWQTNLGSIIPIKSISLNFNNTYSGALCQIWTSNTGAFTGEHTVIPVGRRSAIQILTF